MPNNQRPETGPMQFGDDWPGVFIRGDNAFGDAMYLEQVLNDLAAGRRPSPIYTACLRGLVSLLRGCIVRDGVTPECQKAALVFEEGKTNV